MAHSAGTSASAQDPGKGPSVPSKNASTFTNPKQFVDMIEMLVSGLIEYFDLVRYWSALNIIMYLMYIITITRRHVI